jgi:hypothetical protein
MKTEWNANCLDSPFEKVIPAGSALEGFAFGQ